MSTTNGFDKVLSAFIDGKRRAVKNDHTSEGELRYHGNMIAWFTHEGGVEASLCGWDTPSTQLRLNKLLQAFGSCDRVHHDRKLGLCLSSRELDVRDWFVVAGPMAARAVRLSRQTQVDRLAA